jgi:hypothetical protein
MSLVNLVAAGIVGDYPTLYVLHTAILDEAKQRGGRISGEIGTLPAGSSKGRGASSIAMETRNAEASDDGNFGVSPKAEIAGWPNGRTITSLFKLLFASGLFKLSVASWLRVEEPNDRKIESLFKNGKKQFVAAWLRVEKVGETTFLIARMNSDTSKEFKFELIESKEKSEDALAIYISTTANEEAPYSTRPPTLPQFTVLLSHPVIAGIVGGSAFVMAILPYLFIFLLTSFHKGHSTVTQRAWLMSWLVFNQLFSLEGVLANPMVTVAATASPYVVFVCILAYATPAIGGFVMVGKMLLEFGSCSLSE